MILVVGATGQLGSLITRRLLEQGREVRILVRAGSEYRALEAAGATAVVGDLKDRASLDAATRGVDTVLTTANSAVRSGADNVQSVEIEGNRNLIDAAAASGVKHFIFTSTMGAAPDSAIPLMRGKGLAEQHLKASGVPYTILAPNGFMEVWLPMVIGIPLQSGQPVTLVGEGNRKHTFVSSGDVAAFATAAIDNPASRNQHIFIGGPEALSWKDLVRITSRVVGRELAIRHVTPAEGLPGIPAVVSGLMAGMDT
jgi:uncharacterized protein YbjT (DUF2867 family)